MASPSGSDRSTVTVTVARRSSEVSAGSGAMTTVGAAGRPLMVRSDGVAPGLRRGLCGGGRDRVAPAASAVGRRPPCPTVRRLSSARHPHPRPTSARRGQPHPDRAGVTPAASAALPAGTVAPSTDPVTASVASSSLGSLTAPTNDTLSPPAKLAPSAGVVTVAVGAELCRCRPASWQPTRSSMAPARRASPTSGGWPPSAEPVPPRRRLVPCGPRCHDGRFGSGNRGRPAACSATHEAA